MSAAGPRGLLLDFGSVISASLFERHSDNEARLGLPAGALDWPGPLDPARDPLWQRMLDDDISERDYWAQRAEQTGQLLGQTGWTMQTLLSHVRHTDPAEAVRPAMRQLINQARAAGLRVGILSNELELFYGTAFLQRLDVMQELHCVVDASHTGILKPDPRAYAAAVDGMGLTAGELLFVDDQFRNIQGGVRAGLQTHHFDLRDVPGQIASIAARLRLPWTTDHD